MKNTLLKSVALSALLTGTAVAIPATAYVSTAAAQTTTDTTVKPKADDSNKATDDTMKPDDSMKSDDSSKSDDTMKSDDSSSGDSMKSDDASSGDAMKSGDSSSTNAGASDDGQKIVTEQKDSEVLASTYIGQDIYNASDKSIGEISDLVFDKKGGIKAAVVGVGGFLGIGEKSVAVKFDRIEIQRKPDSADVKLTTDMTAKQLKNAPAFKNLQAKMDEQNAQKAPAGGTGATTGGATGGATGMGTGGASGTGGSSAQ